MRITAPMFLCPLLRPFGVAGRNRLGVSVLSAWTLSGVPLGVQDLWPRFVKAVGKDTVLDQGIPKSASEWLLAGHAHAPEPVTHLAVSVEVGDRRKVVNVVGDRTWSRGVPTEPEPFTTMPLSWDRAFGGEGFAENPLGKGYTGGDTEGVALPNLEVPGSMIRSPGQRPHPAGFGALGIDWPARTRGLGTYDGEWFENDFPGFAKDIDWRVHNVAADDQRRDPPFAPGERIVLHNLVEGVARLETSIPCVAARCFTYRSEATELSEVPLSLRTLWLLPDEDMLVLVFHGSQPIASMLGSEIQGVLLGLDAFDRLRDEAHFARVLAARLDRERGVAEMLDDAPLMPDDMTFPSFEERGEDLSLPSRSGALEANLYAGAELRRQGALRLFREAGFEGGEELFPPRAPPAPSKAPITQQITEAFEQAKAQRKAGEAKLAALRAEALAELTKLGIDASVLDAQRSGPPPILVSQQLAPLLEAVSDARAAGRPLEAFERRLADPDFQRELMEKEAQGRAAYRISAHHTDATPELSFELAPAVRTRVEAAIRARMSLAQADLTGAELSRLDLSGMDLRGAWLEGANLQEANLEGAYLDGAVLAKADLADAVLRGTSLRGANLGKARLLGALVDGCDLGEAILHSADLRGARVIRSDLAGADLSNLRVGQTQFEGSDLSNVTFLQMSLAATRFSDCKFEECNFIEVNLDGASFEQCRMSKAVFVTSTGRGAVFREADLENARFVSGCTFDEADFGRARMTRSTLRSGSFVRSVFDEADLAGSDLSQAKLGEARFHRTDLRRVLATECDLRSAVLSGANLMFAVLQGADLRGTDLRGANLFSADLALVRADHDTSLEGALVTRVRHRPLRKDAHDPA